MPIVIALALASIAILAQLPLELDTVVFFMVLFGVAAGMGLRTKERVSAEEIAAPDRDARSQGRPAGAQGVQPGLTSPSPHAGLQTAMDAHGTGPRQQVEFVRLCGDTRSRFSR